MRKNKAYFAIAFLALLAMLVPNKFIFARAEVSDSDRDKAEEQRLEAQKRAGEDEEEKDKKEIEDQDEDEKMRTGTEKKDDDEDEDEEDEAEEHRSAVASFVKNLLSVAEKNKGGIGEEVREVAKEQEEDQEEVAEAIEKVKNRNRIKTFLIGTDYKNVGMIRSELVRTQNRLEKLNRLLEKMTTSTGATTTAEQIQNLVQAQTKLENFLKANESKFSLFGWFVKLFVE